VKKHHLIIAAAFAVAVSTAWFGSEEQTYNIKEDMGIFAIRSEINKNDLISASWESLKVSNNRVIQHNGSAIFLGAGHSVKETVAEGGLPLVSDARFDYVMIVKRKCPLDDGGCFRAEEVELKGEVNIQPLI
jgi:hypothetical protein